MTRKEIIDGLRFTIEMFLLDPSTGETITEPRNDMDKTTIDACRSAIELLGQEPFMNKPCVAHEVCHEDKVKVLEKIRAEIEPKCDRINNLTSVLPYTAHREIQELLCEIMDLCKAESEE